MFLVWGSKAVDKVQGEGIFHCPSCGIERAYQHVKVDKKFTLYWIPLFSTSTIGEYVKCMFCDNYYKPEVLNYRPGKQEISDYEMDRIFNESFQSILIKMLLADGRIDENEIKAFQVIVAKTTGSIPTEFLIQKKIAEIQTNNQSIEVYVNILSALCNQEGKEMIFKGSFLMAFADGELDDSEMHMLQRISHGLGMSDNEAKRIMNEMANSDRVGEKDRL